MFLQIEAHKDFIFFFYPSTFFFQCSQ